MYSKAKLDAVIVSSDTASHVALATEALEAGLVSFDPRIRKADRQHVLMEKPISVDHKTAQAFVELTKQFPKQKVVVGFSRRCELQPVAANSDLSRRVVPFSQGLHPQRSPRQRLHG